MHRHLQTAPSAKRRPRRRRAFLPALLFLLALLPRPASAQSDTILAQAAFLNQLYDGTPTNAPGTSLAQAASVTLFSGEISLASAPAAPTDGQLYLTQAAIGLAIGGLPSPFFPPGVILLAPANGAVFIAPTNIALNAQAWPSTPSGVVARVDFFATGLAIGTNVLVATVANSTPGTNNFQTNWLNDFPGVCTLTALAADDQGATAPSDPVNVTVVPVILVNGQYTNTHTFTFLANNLISFTMTNPFGGVVLYTTDGSDPLQFGTQYFNGSGQIQVANSETIRAGVTDSKLNWLGEADSVTIIVVPLYPLNASTAGGGSFTVSPPNGPYTDNAVVTLTATPETGWHFIGWQGDVVSASTNLMLTMDGTKTVQAVFGTSLTIGATQVMPGQSLYSQSGGSISVSPSQSLYPFGSSVRLTAVPLNGDYFQTWDFNFGAGFFSGGSNSPLDFVVSNGLPTLDAGFVHISGSPPTHFSLTVEIGSGSGKAIPAPYATLYPSNTPVSITASPSLGQVFLGWSGATTGSANPLSVTISSNTTIIANFSTNSPPTVTITNPPDGADFTWPATIPIDVTAASAGGTVTSVGFFAEDSNHNTTRIGLASAPPFSIIWSNANVGAYTLTAIATNSTGLSGLSDAETVTVNPAPKVFAFSSANYQVHESQGAVTLTVDNFAMLSGGVNYRTLDGSAHGGAGISGDYTTASGNLSFAGQPTATISITILDNFLNGPDRQFQVQLFGPTGGGSLGNPGTATVTILRDDPDATTNALLAQPFPNPQPSMNGQLTVLLQPPQAGGQWRFPWEFAWRNSGGTASNLVTGDYPIQFRNVPGWLAIPLTNSPSVVSGGLPTMVTNQYYQTVLTGSAALGSLTVNVNPPGIGSADWRFFGETTWRANGSTAANLLPDTYDVEFKPVPGQTTPQSVAEPITNGMNLQLTGTYTTALTTTELTPEPVPSIDYGNSPYIFCGQLQTDVGFGSGMAVRNNVVLTAAHMVFNDNTKAYVSNAWWSFQTEAGGFQPEPMAARGWYVLSGYAARRIYDLTNGFSVDEPSLQSSDLDVAALYFLTDVARTGSSGYLSSDAVPNPYLTGPSYNKTLVGYPVDGSVFGQVVTPGEMYVTASPSGSQFPVFVQDYDQVYTAPWLFSYPGNSGGPVCVQYQNANFYPVAVYLGTFFTNNRPAATAVRAIDSNVFNLIDKAATQGDSGTNNSGGGTITIIPTGVSSAHPAYLIVNLGPLAAVKAGAAWEFINQPSKDYLSAAQSVQELDSTTAVGLQFQSIPGWNLPPSQTLTLTPGTTAYNAAYTVAITWPTPAPIASGTPLSSNQLDAVVTTAFGAFSYSPPAGTVLGLGAHTLTVTFTPSQPAKYGGPSTTNVSLDVLTVAPPVIQTAQRTGGSFTFTWSATANQTYQIQWATNLATTNWTALGGLINATNSTMTSSEIIATNSQQFYRILFLP